MFTLSADGTQSLQVVTGAASSTDIVVSYQSVADGSIPIPISAPVNVTTAATTAILAAPTNGHGRRVTGIRVRNAGAITQTVTVQLLVSSTAYSLTSAVQLLAGESFSMAPEEYVARYDVHGLSIAQNKSIVVTQSKHVHYEAPIAADLVTNVAAVDMATGALTLAAQPDFPRKLQIRVVDANSSTTAGSMVLVGVGASGQALTQTFALSGGTATTTTTDAYATITSATNSGVVGAAAGDTIGIGPATALGLPALFSPTATAFAVHKSGVNNANEAVGTVDTVAGTIVPTTVPDGAKRYDFWYTYSYTTQPTMTIAAHVHYEAPITAELISIVAALDPIANANLILAAQPDFPRKLQVRVVDANSSVTAGIVTLIGKGASGQVVTQAISLSGGTATTTTADVYASVTSAITTGVVGAGAGDTIGIGVATALGLPATFTPTPTSFAVHKSNVTNANEAVGTVDTVAGSIVPTSVPNAVRTYDFWYTYQVVIG